MAKGLPREALFPYLLDRVRDMVRFDDDRDLVLQTACDLLKTNVPHYDWVGFYLVNRDDARELVLGPFAGEPTEHVRIPFGRGICGQAAAREETFVVQDVSKEPDYLSCSAMVRSEIVVPIFSARHGTRRIVGELDIDSHALAAFTDEDRRFLEAVCEVVASVF